MNIKIYIFTFMIIFLSHNLYYAQDWTKESRNNLYEDYLETLSSYRNITENQRESVALCCLQETTDKYSKTEYQSKISVELKRIRQSIISQCAKNMGIDLESNSKPTTNDEPVEKSNKKGTFSAEDIGGVWTDGGTTFTFNPKNGTYTMAAPSRTKRAEGTFSMQGRFVVLTNTNMFTDWSAGRYTIISVDGGELILLKDSTTYTLEKQ